MCNAVNFDGQWYQTPRQLARIVGGVVASDGKKT